jgi:signal transduction histidine kinase
MEGAVKRAMIVPYNSPLLGVADESVAQRLADEVERSARAGRVATASSLLQLQVLASRASPQVILFDCDLLQGAPLAESLAQLTALAPVIVLAPLERQAEIAPFVAAGDVEFVARAGDFVATAASLIERRMRREEKSKSTPETLWADLPGEIRAIFRHEINNPLTGILGNAEMLLAHGDRFSAADTQRLQTVVDLAVRLRETIRRLSNAWENHPPSVKSA